MPKLYYPNVDELRGAKPLNENLWFPRWQPLLLKLANTDAGRDLLCIDKKPYPVVFMRKNVVRYYLGRQDGRDHYQSDVRIGAKWGNVIRYRWREVQRALDQVNLRELLALPKLVLLPNGRLVPAIAGGTVTTVYPDPNPETATVDGWTVRDGTNLTWASIRDGAGNIATDTDTTQSAFYHASGSAADTYNQLRRTAYLYDTSAITDTDTISDGVLSIFGNTGTQNNLTIDSVLNLVSVTLASNTAVTTADYAVANWGATKFVTGGFAHSSWSTTAYNDFTLNADGRANISLTGISKFGLRSESDIDNIAFGGPFNGSVDSFEGYFADQTGVTNDPKLVVTHAAAATFVPRVTIF